MLERGRSQMVQTSSTPYGLAKAWEMVALKFSISLG